jgi:hypothetical protein
LKSQAEKTFWRCIIFTIYCYGQKRCCLDYIIEYSQARNEEVREETLYWVGNSNDNSYQISTNKFYEVLVDFYFRDTK